MKKRVKQFCIIKFIKKNMTILSLILLFLIVEVTNQFFFNFLLENVVYHHYSIIIFLFESKLNFQSRKDSNNLER